MNKMQKLVNRKGFAGLQAMVLTIVVVGVILAVGLLILSKFQSKLTSATAEYNATGEIITELATLPTYIGILIIVAIMGIIISYLSGWFGGRGKSA